MRAMEKLTKSKKALKLYESKQLEIDNLKVHDSLWDSRNTQTYYLNHLHIFNISGEKRRGVRSFARFEAGF